MSHLDPDNPFQSWILSPSEIISGSKLTLLQKQVIQNQIAEFMQRKMKLKVDPNNITKFIQAEAELQGSIDTLMWLLTISKEVESASAATSFLNSQNQEL